MPDLLILDINMPTGDGLCVAEKLLRDPKIPPLPVIFCSGRADLATLDRCRSLGANHVTKGPDAWPKLRALINDLFGSDKSSPAAARSEGGRAIAEMRAAPQAEPPKVLCVDDDEEALRVLAMRLRACGLKVLTATTAMQALWVAMKAMPQVVVTDYLMPEGSGEYLIARLRAVPALKPVPIIVVTGASRPNNRDFALERRFLGEYGVAGFLSKPLQFDMLLEALGRHVAFDASIWRKAAALRAR
jgi:CheY-like chemotaxis protein